MKKALTLICAAALIVGCSPKQQYGEVTKVADYLYEVTYEDMDESLFDQVQDVQNKCACSSVRNGAFHGRNLDLYYNEGVEVIVHMKAGKDRFASVAVCGATPDLTAEAIEKADPKMMAKLPLLTLDGINEKHVAVNVNVVPSIDSPIATGTNPGKKKMHMAVAPRYILNHAESAANAVELLKDRDLFGGFGSEFGLHLMISDPKETYIVEIINNEIKTRKGGREDIGNVMTNFYCTLPELTPHADGVERCKILKDNYAEGSTEEGMAKLMQRVKYSQAYVRGTDPFWDTESCGLVTTDDGRVVDVTIDTPHDSVMVYMEDSFKAFERHERKGEFWQTVHTSVFDIDKCTLLVFVQEDYNHSYKFEI